MQELKKSQKLEQMKNNKNEIDVENKKSNDMKNIDEMKEIIHITNCQYFTVSQAEQYLKNKVSRSNYEIILAHLSHPDLAKEIEGFTEQDGVLYLKVAGEMISTTKSCQN